MPLQLHPDVVTTDTDNGTVLLHMGTGRYWQLNTAGSDILRQLLDGQGPHQIAAEVATRHGIDPHQAHSDISAVIEHLQTARLVISA